MCKEIRCVTNMHTLNYEDAPALLYGLLDKFYMHVEPV